MADCFDLSQSSQLHRNMRNFLLLYRTFRLGGLSCVPSYFVDFLFLALQLQSSMQSSLMFSVSTTLVSNSKYLKANPKPKS